MLHKICIRLYIFTSVCVPKLLLCRCLSHKHIVAATNAEVVSKGLLLALHNWLSLTWPFLLEECLLCRIEISISKAIIAQGNITLLKASLNLLIFPGVQGLM